MKIQKIEVNNFKAIKEQELELNGCSAIITAGNNEGKSSLLKGLIERFQGLKPSVIVKQGESKGLNKIELTDGSIIEWNFTEKGSERFSFTKSDGVQIKTGVLSAIGAKYFGIPFDIDKFINRSAKEQTKELQKIIGLDLSEIEDKYKTAYEDRTFKNRTLAAIVANKKTKPIEVECPDTYAIKDKIKEAKGKNEKLLAEWKIDNEKHLSEIQSFNNEQIEKINKIHTFDRAWGDVKKSFENFHKDTGISLEAMINLVYDSISDERLADEEIKEHKELKSLPEPSYIDITELESALEGLNAQLKQFESYERELSEYENWVESGKTARNEANDADKHVKGIEKEKADIIANSKMPSGFEIIDNTIMYNGFALDNSTISTSQKYIAALKLGSLGLGELQTLHFDASFLDNKSLSEVQDWADSNNLQLLIERPDLDGGKIKYEII